MIENSPDGMKMPGPYCERNGGGAAGGIGGCGGTGACGGTGGALLRNLWVEGAAVAGGSLAEVASDAPPLSEAPQCAISFVQDDGAAADRASLDRLPVPLYVDTSRAAALCDLEVECAASQVDSWTLHSPAFFLAQGQ